MGKCPLEGYPSHPLPHPVENPRNLHVEQARMQDADAKSRRGIGTRRYGERGENNTKHSRSLTD
jgi:hypothetical protein